MSGIDYGGQDFRAKMAKFGAKMNQQQLGGYGGGNRRKPPAPQSGGYNQGGYNKGVSNQASIKPSGGYSSQSGARQPRKNLVKSKAARAMGRNEDAIKVNLDSVRSKVKFGRLVVYSVNCLGKYPYC